MGSNEAWSCDANKAVSVELVQRGAEGPKRLSRFHPKFTYPVFGETQTIFGYRGLKINLRFAGHDLSPNLNVSWDEQYETVGETSALDVTKELKPWLSEEAFEPRTAYHERVQSESNDFKPPGELVKSYAIGDRQFEIWKGRLVDPNVQRILRRMQIFISFFIEGGTYINLDEPEWSLSRWSIYFLYERQTSTPTPSTSPYVLVGYSTVYDFYLPISPAHKSTPSKTATIKFPLEPPTTYPHRSRISQFLILPPYQHQGHGSRFYGALVDQFLADDTCVEITIEDPNEAFDDLRDRCDLARLRSGPRNSEFTSIRIDASLPVPRKGRLPTAKILPKQKLDALRRATKIAPRQFDRLVEMHLLSLVPANLLRTSRQVLAALNVSDKAAAAAADKDPQGKTEYALWRLITKQRLYKFNKDKLAQVDLPERIKNLEEVTDGVEADYLRLLSSLESNGTTSTSSSTKRGRDEDEEGSAKRVRQD